nr:hypothetical protein [Vibrio palustris]
MKKLDAPNDMQIGTRFATKKHGYAVVVEYYNTYTVIIAFENTGNIRSTTAAKLRCGQVLDRSVPSQSTLVGKIFISEKYGPLTVVQVDSDNIVVLHNSAGEEIRMIRASVEKLRETSTPDTDPQEALQAPTSLSALTKRSKKTKDVNSLLKKMLADYGK